MFFLYYCQSLLLFISPYQPTHSSSRPSSSVNPSSEPPYYTTLPTKFPTPELSDTLQPTTTTMIPTTIKKTNAPVSPSPSKAPAIEFIITMRPGTTKPTYESSYGGTPTVSKETTAPPTMVPRRPATEEHESTTSDSSIKQLGSNDYKPNYVYTSKVETECDREEDEELVRSEEQIGCVLRCKETTKLYEGNTLLSEASKLFESDCPDDADGEEGSYIRSIEKTIEDGTMTSVVRSGSVGPNTEEDPYRVFETSQDENSSMETSEADNDGPADYYDDYNY